MLARDMLHGSSKQPQRVTPFTATTTFIIIPPRPTPHPTPTQRARDVLHGSSKQPQRVTHFNATTTFIIILPHPTHPTPHPHSARVTCDFKTTTTCHTLQCNYNVCNYPAPPHPPHPHTHTARAWHVTSKQPQRVTHFNATTTFIIIPPHPTHPARDVLQI